MNPECGPFKWDPAPGENSPVTIGISVSPAQPKAGQQVTFYIVIDDPDAAIQGDSYAASFGESGTVVDPNGPIEDFPSCKQGYGPWVPPKKIAGHWEMTLQHVYEAPGTYKAGFAFHSHNLDQCQDAYGSRGAGTVTVVVS